MDHREKLPTLQLLLLRGKVRIRAKARGRTKAKAKGLTPRKRDLETTPSDLYHPLLSGKERVQEEDRDHNSGHRPII